jgi:hypothetical protein
MFDSFMLSLLVEGGARTHGREFQNRVDRLDLQPMGRLHEGGAPKGRPFRM